MSIFGLIVAMVASFGLGMFFGWYISLPDPTTPKRKNRMKDWGNE